MSARELQINTLQDQCTELKMQLRATKDERDLLAKQLIDAENNSKLNLKKLKVSEKEKYQKKKLFPLEVLFVMRERLLLGIRFVVGILFHYRFVL